MASSARERSSTQIPRFLPQSRPPTPPSSLPSFLFRPRLSLPNPLCLGAIDRHLRRYRRLDGGLRGHRPPSFLLLFVASRTPTRPSPRLLPGIYDWARRLDAAVGAHTRTHEWTHAHARAGGRIHTRAGSRLHGEREREGGSRLLGTHAYTPTHPRGRTRRCT